MAGSIKVKAKLENDEVTVKALITHPMETGLRKDKKTGETIPAHFIQEVVCSCNGKTVMTADWSGGVSQNPYLSFKFKGAKVGDKLQVAWKDNKGEGDTETTDIA